ncbi:Syntaxin-like protein [Thalictrum thalictroides]|uniref:Syntaxin-like protein n=1 Tax=Thalictrum thalictroides TaxID=46969 RepID=A0A7J6WCN4_THATH|nr:Syntaxin-like protein [Thalictrum thalictroides]
MNDLFSNSFSRFKSEPNDSSPPRQQQGNVQMSAMGANLDKFFEDVEGIKDELKEIETLHQQLHQSHEQLKTIHNAKSIKDLRSKMDSDISLATKKAKLIKVRLEALDRSNASNRTQPGCGPGSSSDRTRTSVVNGLRKKLKDSMDGFNSLRQEIGIEYKETVKRRFFTITGESPDDRTVEILISTGESETLLQKAIQEQGRGTVMATVSEIQERFDAVKDIEKSLMELHQVFLDMAVMVEVQGEQLDDIESQVGRASSFVTRGTEQLQVAKKHQRSTRKWTCIAIIILIIVILIVVLPIVLRNTGGNNNNSSPNPTPNPTPSTNPTPTPPTGQ